MKTIWEQARALFNSDQEFDEWLTIYDGIKHNGFKDFMLFCKDKQLFNYQVAAMMYQATTGKRVRVQDFTPF